MLEHDVEIVSEYVGLFVWFGWPLWRLIWH